MWRKIISPRIQSNEKSGIARAREKSELKNILIPLFGTSQGSSTPKEVRVMESQFGG